MATKLLDLTKEVTKLKSENYRLCEQMQKLNYESSRVEFAWEIPDFDDEIEEEIRFDSPDFIAFGHIFYLVLKEEEDDYYALYLQMRSTGPDKLGFKFSLGRYEATEGSHHIKSHDSQTLFDYSPLENKGGWGKGKFAHVNDFTTEKLLTPEGDLQIKVVVYNTMPTA
jgi:hypothetical protein